MVTFFIGLFGTINEAVLKVSAQKFLSEGLVEGKRLLNRWDLVK